MSLEYPDFVDPQKAAEGQRVFSGTVPVKRMERLKPFLAADSGEAGFTAQFEKDSLVGVKITVTVDAVLWLLCQKSLEPYPETIVRTSVLGVIDDIGKEGLLPEGYEAVLADNGRISFVELVEDELILGLPQVPRNPQLPWQEEIDGPEGSGDETQARGEEPRQHPFADLAEQLKEFAQTKKDSAGNDNSGVEE